jgi:hypothetical protein
VCVGGGGGANIGKTLYGYLDKEERGGRMRVMLYRSCTDIDVDIEREERKRRGRGD